MGDNHYFIVGGSSGIGLAIVRELAGRGDTIYVGSRSAESLVGLEGVHHLPLDVREP